MLDITVVSFLFFDIMKVYGDTYSIFFQGVFRGAAEVFFILFVHLVSFLWGDFGLFPSSGK